MSSADGPLEVPADEVAGTLAARRQLGPDSEDAVIAAFLDRAGTAIDRRVEQRLANAPVPAVVDRDHENDREARKDAMKLALGSIALGIPVTGAASALEGAGPYVAVAAWIAIGVINAVFSQHRRR